MWRNRRRLDLLYGINRRNVELVYGNNRRSDYPLVDDKIVCKSTLERAGVPVARTIATCDGLYSVAGVVNELRNHARFVVKPASASGGDGIIVTGDRGPDGWEVAGGGLLGEDDLREHLANIVFGTFSKTLEDRALVEERIEPHRFFATMFAGGLSDIRLIVLRGRLLMAMIRVPTVGSGGRANLHQGGVGIAVDLETGRTTRSVRHRRQADVHPDNGAQLVGLQVPDWDLIREVGARAAETVPLGYLGVDIVVDADRGPLVLEMNARPGLEIQNVNAHMLGELVPGVAP